ARASASCSCTDLYQETISQYIVRVEYLPSRLRRREAGCSRGSQVPAAERRLSTRGLHLVPAVLPSKPLIPNNLRCNDQLRRFARVTAYLQKEFTAIVESRPGGGIAIKLPFDPSSVWGERGRYDVTGSINGYKVRGKLTPRADGHVLQLGPAWCRDATV